MNELQQQYRVLLATVNLLMTRVDELERSELLINEQILETWHEAENRCLARLTKEALRPHPSGHLFLDPSIAKPILRALVVSTQRARG